MLRFDETYRLLPIQVELCLSTLLRFDKTIPHLLSPASLFTSIKSGGASLLLLSLLTSFSFKPFTFVHSLRGGTRRFSRLYNNENNNNHLHDNETNNNLIHYDASKQIADIISSIVIIYKIVTGYQQTILPLNESSSESQSLLKVVIVYRHTLLSSTTASMKSQPPNKFLKIDPGTSYSSILYYADNGNSFTNAIELFSNKFMSRMNFYYLDLTSLEISSLPIIHYSFNNPTYFIFISIYTITGCVVI